MTLKKIFFMVITFVLSLVGFIILDVGIDIEQIGQMVQPLFFALAFTINIFYFPCRKYMLRCGLGLLGLMIVLYLFQMLIESDWIGRLGFGILFITIFTYLPELIKKGYVEKF